MAVRAEHFLATLAVTADAFVVVEATAMQINPANPGTNFVFANMVLLPALRLPFCCTGCDRSESRLVGVSRTRIFDAVRNRELTVRKASRVSLVMRDDLLAWIRSLPVKGAGGRKMITNHTIGKIKDAARR